MAEPFLTQEPSESIYTSVLTKINNSPDVPHLTIKKEVDGLKINPPEKSSLLSKYTSSPAVSEIIDGLYTHLIETPLLEYSDMEGTDQQVVDADEKILGLFEYRGPEWQVAFRDILAKNRYRVNSLLVLEQIPLLSMKLEKNQPDVAQKIEEIYENVNRIEIAKTYKESSKEDKLKTIRQYTKAAELTLKALDGQEISEQDIESMKALNPNLKSQG